MPRVSNVFQRWPHLHVQRASRTGTQRHFGHWIGEPSGARIGVPCMAGGGRHVLRFPGIRVVPRARQLIRSRQRDSGPHRGYGREAQPLHGPNVFRRCRGLSGKRKLTATSSWVLGLGCRGPYLRDTDLERGRWRGQSRQTPRISERDVICEVTLIPAITKATRQAAPEDSLSRDVPPILGVLSPGRQDNGGPRRRVADARRSEIRPKAGRDVEGCGGLQIRRVHGWM